MREFFKKLLDGTLYFFLTYSPIIIGGFVLICTFVFKYGPIYDFLFADGSLFDFVQCLVFLDVYLVSFWYLRNEILGV